MMHSWAVHCASRVPGRTATLLDTWLPGWECSHPRARHTARAMSRENVEIVRRGYEAFLRSEWDEAAQLLDPDVELHGTVGGLSEGSVVLGLQQIRQEFEQED